MEARELELLEKFARLMPGDKLEFGRTDDREYGTIYFATSIDADRCPHGIWGCRGTARILDFKPDTSFETVRQVLVNDAVGWIEGLVKKGVLRRG